MREWTLRNLYWEVFPHSLRVAPVSTGPLASSNESMSLGLCQGDFAQQDLRRRDAYAEVTFVSHEWSGLQHPDPQMLSRLQGEVHQ